MSDARDVRSLGALGGFVAELQRRHVFRVAIVYCAVAWVIAEVSATFLPALGVPDWSVSLVAVLLVLGLPIALVLAWAFDLTPDGVKRTQATPAAPAALAVRSVTTGPALVVLPFVDRSPGAEHQYLGDGITEELTNALARVDGLDVVSRTSAFALHAERLDARSIGERLAVTHVVEGSIRVSERRLRLALQLIDVSSGYAAWAETFDRSVDDVFCVQEEIARAFVDALRPAVLPEPLLQSSTADFDAYAHYLRGRQQWNMRTPDALRRALDRFNESIAIDPDFAHAYAGVADCWAILVDHGIVAPSEGLPRARRGGVAALRFGPRLAEAHTSNALVRQLEWEWAEAEAGFRTALELNPGYVVARQRLALLLAWLGRTAEARDEIRRAVHADPLSPLVLASAGWVEYFDGRYDDAIRIERDILEYHPDAAPARVPLALALSHTGRADDAVAVLQADDPAGTPPLLGLVAYALGRAGRTDDALHIIASLEAVTTSYVSPFVLAQAWLGVGDEPRALEALERAADQRAPQLVYLLADPMFAALKDCPSLEDITARLLAAA
jgi:TolB-like protein